MGYAEAIVKDDAPPDKCVPGGPDIVPRIHAVLGEGELAHAEMGSGTADVVIAHDPWPVKSEPAISNVAFVACGGGNNVKYRYNYVGLATCAAADQVGGGFKECYTACQGLGDCVRACQFDAMSIIDGIAVVDTEKCTGCSLCVPACPKNLISMVPGNAAVVVRCSNHLKGKSVSNVCDVGCIACNKCQKNCPSEAFTVRDSLAEVDYGKCTGQLVCVSDCPANCLFEGPAAPYAAAMSPRRRLSPRRPTRADGRPLRYGALRQDPRHQPAVRQSMQDHRQRFERAASGVVVPRDVVQVEDGARTQRGQALLGHLPRGLRSRPAFRRERPVVGGELKPPARSGGRPCELAPRGPEHPGRRAHAWLSDSWQLSISHCVLLGLDSARFRWVSVWLPIPWPASTIARARSG